MTVLDVLSVLTAWQWAGFAGLVLAICGAGVLVWYYAVPPALPPDPGPPPTPAPAGTFDEHAAAVTALLTPDDPLLDDDAARIADAVARAVDQYASYLIAKRDGAPADVLHQLTEQMYADLRRSLTPPQLARALVAGLHPHADDRARALLDLEDLSVSDLES